MAAFLVAQIVRKMYAAEVLELLPPNTIFDTWSIGTKCPLHRETNKAQIAANISCTIQILQNQSNYLVVNFTKLVNVNILDIDNYPPRSQNSGETVIINMDNDFIKKNYEIHYDPLLFLDKDSVEVNHYNATIVTVDKDDLLQPWCDKYPDRRDFSTVIHCKIVFKKNNQFRTRFYNFSLILADVTLRNKSVAKEAIQNVTLAFKDASNPKIMQLSKGLLLYPEKYVKIFRNAAPYARVTQPAKSTGKLSNFTLEENGKNRRNVFDVTHDGIVYVANSNYLRNSPDSIRLRITWFKKNVTKFDDVLVRVMNESNETCMNTTELNEWTYCAQFKTYNECVDPDSCGLGTGGAASVEKRKKPERCMWRGDRRPGGTKTTNYYSTCTPDPTYCPDSACDSLEILLRDELCPQDCTEQRSFPTLPNAKSNVGVLSCSGVVYCQATGCTCDTLSPIVVASSKKEVGNTIIPSLAESQKKEFYTNKYDSHRINRTKCGASCILGIIFGALGLIAIACTIVIWRVTKARRDLQNKYNQECQSMVTPLSVSDYIERNHSLRTDEAFQLNFRMNSTITSALLQSVIKKFEYDAKWEFSRNQLKIEQTLGEGEFGRVLKATALNIAGQTGYSVVAVKTLKEDAGESELNDLLSEYQLLKGLSHKNVIRLLGVCTTADGPPYLMIEFAEHGSLRNYLRNCRNSVPADEITDEESEKITSKDVLSFAWQICNGMSYLTDLRLVHRDLASRNVLVDCQKTCKISDFGLTRDVYEDNAYFKRSKGRVPVKWMAPESLADHIYTTKSDVWSFGILLWELVTLGATPYPGIAVHNLYNLLLRGYRMEKPPNCSQALYNEMKKCWNLNPDQRPSFKTFTMIFERMLSDDNEYLDLTCNAFFNKSYFSILPDNADEVANNVQNNNLLSNVIDDKQLTVDNVKEMSSLLVDATIARNMNANTSDGYESPSKYPKPVNVDEEYTNMMGNNAALLANSNTAVIKDNSNGINVD